MEAGQALGLNSQYMWTYVTHAPKVPVMAVVLKWLANTRSTDHLYFANLGSGRTRQSSVQYAQAVLIFRN
jgi:hypothetical protein